MKRFPTPGIGDRVNQTSKNEAHRRRTLPHSLVCLGIWGCSNRTLEPLLQSERPAWTPATKYVVPSRCDSYTYQACSLHRFRLYCPRKTRRSRILLNTHLLSMCFASVVYPQLKYELWWHKSVSGSEHKIQVVVLYIVLSFQLTGINKRYHGRKNSFKVGAYESVIFT
jgi:hypothetical protein